MLTHINIKNFAIIDDLSIDFHSGMTVITGETGSGKSILIHALEVCFGKRIEKHMLQSKEKSCEVTTVFELDNNNDVNDWLSDNNISDDSDIIIRRVVNLEGRSKNYINNTLVNLNKIKEFTSLLINIHGQHENQALMKPDMQLRMLDNYANLEKLISTVNDIFYKWKNINEKIEALKAKQSDTSRQEFIKFQLIELESFAIPKQELIELEKQHQILAKSEDIIQYCQESIDLIDNNDGVLNKLHNIVNNLSHYSSISNSIKQTNDCIDQAIIQTQEGLTELQEYMANFTYDQQKLNELNSKLQKIYDIAKKHNTAARDLHEHKINLESELSKLTQSNQSLDVLIKEKESLETQYLKISEELSNKRKKASVKLSKDVTKNLILLDIKGPFKAVIKNKKTSLPQLNGLDEIAFIIHTNQGSDGFALNKIASGGELSRISLALQSVIATQYSTPTLIFDEVDVGISGATAEIVGKLLKSISTNSQIICITHLEYKMQTNFL